MWTRVYFLLILVRLYLALSPSYIHPDENFQGPEVIAGHIFGFPHHRTWEFSASQPTRSVFPLWPVYGLPMTILQWIWTETGEEEVAPKIVFYTLRVVMFILSFVLEDWAIHELVQSPRQRRVAVILVASSYVTSTYQTHTFSNSIETLLVLWSLVLIGRILETKERSSLFASSSLGFLAVFGVFNRITFPAFLFVPGCYLLPHLIRKPLSLVSLLLAAAATTLVALQSDISFYLPKASPFSVSALTPTPLSSLWYNINPSNLAHHGTHPFYQHILVNLPLLILPAIPVLIQFPLFSMRLTSAISGAIILSLFSHQEARFLLPCVPLLLSSLRLPRNINWRRAFIVSWILFNTLLGVLMGIYHQGGVMPMQIWLGEQNTTTLSSATEVFWWRTYSPPIWLLDGNPMNISTIDLMGQPVEDVIARIDEKVTCGKFQRSGMSKESILVAPASSADIDIWTDGTVDEDWRWVDIHTESRHLNLDDLDWEDGVVYTLKRVLGRRGLRAWRVGRDCGHVTKREK